MTGNKIPNHAADLMLIFLRYLLLMAITAAALFGSAGRWDLPFFWIVFGIYIGIAVLARFLVDPDLLEERIRPKPGGRDRYLRWMMMPLIFCHWILAGLDAGRFHWTDTIPRALQAAAVLVFVAGLGCILWAMMTNRFFSPVVRIQSERGHHLITSGPYRFVRHPGYTGSIVSAIGGGLSLGSWWAMLPLLPLVLGILRRTILEDQFLFQHLDGYREYARKVRFRLFPMLW